MNRIEDLRNAKQQFANDLMNMDKFMNYLINLTEKYELELNKKEQENIITSVAKISNFPMSLKAHKISMHFFGI